MNVHARTTNGPLADIPLFNPFAGIDRFWWSYPSFAKALLDAQQCASALLEANGKLMEEMGHLSLQISRQMLDGANGSNRPAMSRSSDVNSIFDCAITNWRELGDAWMNAQIRSLDAIRGQTSTDDRRHARQRTAARDKD